VQNDSRRSEVFSDLLQDAEVTTDFQNEPLRPDAGQIRAAATGDAAALHTLLTGLAPTVRRYATRLCGVDERDDVVQETLLAVTRGLPGFRGDGSLRAWVWQLTRSACAHQHRRQRPALLDEAESVDGWTDPAPGPEGLAGLHQLEAQLAQALDALPADQREAVLLRDLQGMSAADAAAEAGIGVDAFKSRLHRGRAALRERLAPWMGEEAPPEGPACMDMGALWSQHVEGELSPQTCRELEAHLAACPRCDAACARARRVLAACAAEPGETAPEALRRDVERTLAALRLLPQRPQPVRANPATRR
jgi:RNA polymerase sigma-70 factor (ECF subfamily)